MIKKNILIIFILISACHLYAQNTYSKKGYLLKAKNDYFFYEGKIPHDTVIVAILSDTAKNYLTEIKYFQRNSRLERAKEKMKAIKGNIFMCGDVFSEQNKIAYVQVVLTFRKVLFSEKEQRSLMEKSAFCMYSKDSGRSFYAVSNRCSDIIKKVSVLSQN